jgi:hypothetical protein
MLYPILTIMSGITLCKFVPSIILHNKKKTEEALKIAMSVLLMLPKQHLAIWDWEIDPV